ncbi:MAG: TetR/AcrR family transcriptional regulator [Curvibacter sp.]|nr:TetR/AcrR family transcriptional regulator [Curvibacter sp.]
MPRVSRQQTEQHRAAIEEASSRLFRERGIQAVSVADLMRAAGLTHGGFYGHFESKEALAGVACAKAFAQSVERWQGRIEQAERPAQARAAIVRAYLSEHSRDSAGLGCPASALATDAAREEPASPLRQNYLGGVSQLLDLLAQVQPAPGTEVARRQALVELSLMVGAQMLARATQGNPLSEAVLDAACEHLLPLAEPDPPRGRADPDSQPPAAQAD